MMLPGTALASGCRWPLWGDEAPTFEYCNAKPAPGSSYCCEHHAVTHKETKKRGRRWPRGNFGAKPRRNASLIPQVTPPGFTWTDDRKATMRAMWAAGDSAGDIAIALGCSKGAVTGQRMRLGLEKRRMPERIAMAAG